MEKKNIKRYTRRQVRRNRRIAFFALLVLAALLVALLVWGISGLFHAEEGPDVSSSLSSSSHLLNGHSSSSSQAEESLPEESLPESSADSGASSQAVSSSSSSQPVSSAASSVGSDDPYYEADMPLLVNPDHLMPEGYEPTVVSIGDGYKLETKAAAAWQDMQAAAADDGVSLWAISAYRTLERQTELYEEKVAEYQALGYDEEQAKEEAGKWVAVPGTSEHCLGYAMDLCSLENNFEDSAQFQWLQEHCADYGFILRYPKDKVEITKISYEPWHYRYVGSNHAKIIMSQGICLEEYLEQYGG